MQNKTALYQKKSEIQGLKTKKRQKMLKETKIERKTRNICAKSGQNLGKKQNKQIKTSKILSFALFKSTLNIIYTLKNTIFYFIKRLT